MFTRKDIKLLNARLKKEKAKWRAIETPLSKLTTAQFKRMLGWVRPQEKTTRGHEMSLRMPNWSPGDPFDESVDWRNRNGKNYVTPVKAQGGCGTCVSFAVIGLVESMALIEKGVLLDLSESDLAFCGSHVADCGAWGEGGALGDMKGRGVVSEKKFPYTSAFPGNDSWNSPPACYVIPNHDKYAVKISDFANIYSVADRKSYLTHVGPLICGISVYDEFSSYGQGIYSPSKTAQQIGGHDILIIGYSEIDQCWILKNSWDTTWGEKGFGKIAYGACDIDTETATMKTYFTSCHGINIPDAVLDELVPEKGHATLIKIPRSIFIDGFYSDDDHMRHAIAGTLDGQIFEVFFSPKTGHGKALLGMRNGLVDLGAFYTDDDKFRHVVLADKSGAIAEIFYSQISGINTVELGNVPNAIRVCGFFTPDDNYRHAIVATSEGEIVEIFYGRQGKGQSKIGTVQEVADICCFYSPDDKYRHVIVGSSDGNITEFFYHPKKGSGQTVLTNVPNLKRLGGFYAPNHNSYNRRVLVLSQGQKLLDLSEIRYSPADGAITNPLLQGADVADLGGFYSADDKMAHAILALRSSDIEELFYGP